MALKHSVTCGRVHGAARSAAGPLPGRRRQLHARRRGRSARRPVLTAKVDEFRTNNKALAAKIDGKQAKIDPKQADLATRLAEIETTLETERKEKRTLQRETDRRRFNDAVKDQGRKVGLHPDAVDDMQSRAERAGFRFKDGGVVALDEQWRPGEFQAARGHPAHVVGVDDGPARGRREAPVPAEQGRRRHGRRKRERHPGRRACHRRPVAGVRGGEHREDRGARDHHTEERMMGKPIKFNEANFVWKGWEETDDRPKVLDLHAFRDGDETISCWSMTLMECGFFSLDVWLRVGPASSCVGGDFPFHG